MRPEAPGRERTARTPPSPGAARLRGLWLLATLVGLLFLWAAGARLDLRAVRAAIGSARLWPWLPLGVASYLAGHGVRGMRLRRLVHREALLTTGGATQVVVVGYAVNDVLPARLGEIARAWMLTERSGLSLVQTLTVTAAERWLDAVALLGWLGISAALLPVGPAQEIALRVVIALVAVATALLGTGVLFPAPVLAVASRIANRWALRSQDRFMRRVHAVLNGLSALRRPRTALAVALLTALVWLCEAGLYLAMLPALGIAARPSHALFAMSSTNLGILLPSTPGFVGPFHFFCSQALVAFGVPRETAFAYAVLVHAAFFVPITLWGLGVLAAHGLSVGRTLSLSRAAEPLLAFDTLRRTDLAESETAPSRFDLALAEAAVPLGESLTPSERAEAAREVAAFVAGQMRQLPVRLRVAFAAGILAFRAATRLRYGRGFCELAPEPRRAWFERWAYGSWTLGRQLFRAVRSTALVAWYELPAARAALEEAGAERPAPLPAEASR